MLNIKISYIGHTLTEKLQTEVNTFIFSIICLDCRLKNNN